MIKLSATLIIFYSFVISAALVFASGYPAAVSCLVGGFMMLINLLGLSFVWGQIFSKKSILLATLVILFKYIFLAALLWAFSRSNWIHPAGFVLGLSTLILSILSMTAIKSFVNKNA